MAFIDNESGWAWTPPTIYDQREVLIGISELCASDSEQIRLRALELMGKHYGLWGGDGHSTHEPLDIRIAYVDGLDVPGLLPECEQTVNNGSSIHQKEGIPESTANQVIVESVSVFDNPPSLREGGQGGWGPPSGGLSAKSE